MKSVLVTGAAGFIGSNLVDRLLALGVAVTGYDNFSTGMEDFLAGARAQPAFRLCCGDVLDTEKLASAMAGHDMVFHLAANADVRFGTAHPGKDLEQNAIATHSVLEAMRCAGIGCLAFASTGSIYGEAAVVPTPEDAPFPIQTSLYGASKLAAEGMISAYAEGFGLRAFIFRFVSILGPRYTHGHVFDFVKKLKSDPTRLDVLGNGRQRKSYLHVQDCIDAMVLAVDKAAGKVNIFNLGVDAAIELTQSIDLITQRLGLTPRLFFAGGERGWIGDSPLIHLDISRISQLGWKPRKTIAQGICETVDWLVDNPWVFQARSA